MIASSLARLARQTSTLFNAAVATLPAAATRGASGGGADEHEPLLVLPMPKLSPEMKVTRPHGRLAPNACFAGPRHHQQHTHLLRAQEGTLSKWLKAEGDAVARYDLVCEVGRSLGGAVGGGAGWGGALGPASSVRRRVTGRCVPKPPRNSPRRLWPLELHAACSRVQEAGRTWAALHGTHPIFTVCGLQSRNNPRDAGLDQRARGGGLPDGGLCRHRDAAHREPGAGARRRGRLRDCPGGRQVSQGCWQTALSCAW